MAITTAAAVVGAAAYLDAKYFIRDDLRSQKFTFTKAKQLKYVEQSWKQGRFLTYHLLEDHALRDRPDQIFLIFEGKHWTYKQFYDDIQRVGNWLMNDLKVKKREIVAIDGGNSPAHLILWFALEGIGAAPSFINCNLTSKPLIHCVRVCEGRYLLADRDVKDLVSPVEEELEKDGVRVVYYDTESLCKLPLGDQIPPARQAGLRLDEVGSLIYTSGTTGLPKACILRRGRNLNTGEAAARRLRLTSASRMYTCMPLYHGAANSLCVTPIVHAGGSIALSRKFSHRTFWKEICESEANILQYVGELCRYVLNAPPSDLDRKHQIRMAWGNGFQGAYWPQFRQRFGIEVINELYAATDGLNSCANENRGEFTRGAIDKRGLLWDLVYGSTEIIAKVDPVTEELLRDKDGFVIKCGTNEPGEMLVYVDPSDVDTAFAGYYNNKGASQKRLIRDVFKKGDVRFRSGDMMRQDKDGRLYFVDRLGDTFRWKSENVSTNEVSDVIGSFPNVAEANVYGVVVPKTEGRCGCAALVFSSGVNETSFDFSGLANYAVKNLPRYAVPIFLRLTSQLEYTGTLKLQKGKLRQEGIDLSRLGSDRMYWLPNDASAYRPFTHEDFGALNTGKLHL